jgi:hypothetical protein
LVKEEGFLALYKGLVPAVMQIGPQMGLQFGFYALFQGVWRQFFEIEKHANLQKKIKCFTHNDYKLISLVSLNISFNWSECNVFNNLLIAVSLNLII